MHNHSQKAVVSGAVSYAARPHVLVVDDDRRIRELLGRYLNENGFVAMTAADGTEALAALADFAFDILVVDVMMPGMSGLDLSRAVKGRQDIPVLLLTALGEAQSRIDGFESGADDYLTKPFEPRELVLRLQAILKRTFKAVPTLLRLRLGEFVLDMQTGRLSAKGADSVEGAQLTGAEMALIRSLALTPGQVVSREDLAQRAGLEAGERTIDVQVTRLRRKIEPDAKTPIILQTIRGKGYILHCDVL